MQIAQGIERGVYYCDADRKGGTKNSNLMAQRRFEEVHEKVRIGLEGTKAIPMVALHMIECWLLGDKKAIEKTFGVMIEDWKMPNTPEFLWGDDMNPMSNYPKNYLKRLIRESDKRYEEFQGNRADFCSIAEASDISTMLESCPVSYGRFYDEFTDMVSV